MSRRRRVLLAVAAVGVAAGAGAWGWVTTPRQTAAERGHALYRSLGCEGCHGPGGTGGVANPGSQERAVPGFTGGTAMMYVESDDDLRQWILDGRPARLAESPAGPKALLKMPAYRDHISDAELDDLVAWYRAVAEYEESPPDAAAGREVAAKAGCFGCHGVGGRVGVSNPGALKGYIPGWGSEDFFELVRSEAELREWILDGVPERLADHPIAARFRERQLLQMPAYRNVLTPADIDALVVYVRWVTGGWTAAR